MDAPITMRGLPDLRATGERRHPPQQAIAMPITTSAARWPDRTPSPPVAAILSGPNARRFRRRMGKGKRESRGARGFLSLWLGAAPQPAAMVALSQCGSAVPEKWTGCSCARAALGATASPCQGGPRNTHRALVPPPALGITISRTHLMKPSNPLNMALCLAAHRVNCCSAVTA